MLSIELCCLLVVYVVYWVVLFGSSDIRKSHVLLWIQICAICRRKSLVHFLNDHNIFVYYDGKYSSQHHSSWEFVIWKEAECQSSVKMQKIDWKACISVWWGSKHWLK